MNERKLSDDEKKLEWTKCSESFLYFIDSYVQIYNATQKAWVPFKLWKSQAWVLRKLESNRLMVLLKARQLGQTWLMLAYVLWLMLFKPAAAIGIFSRREEEAIDLLDNRLKGMYSRLPEYLQSRETVTDSKKLWELSNGSWARAFPSNAGDSYTFSFAMVDEADLVPDLDRLLAGVKPTIDGGGWFVLLSRADKKTPESTFKQIYRAAKQGLNEYFAVFLPWNAHPDRTPAWYAAQVADSLSTYGSLDYVHEQYPATDVQALAPRSLDKRINPDWLEACYREMMAAALMEMAGAPAVSGLEIYKEPVAGRVYVMGADPAEGNPTSDDSAATVLDAVTGEEMAALAGKFQPQVFGGHLDALGRYYNFAPILVERNNHGHAVIAWLLDYGGLPILAGLDDRPGWVSSSLGKTVLYDNLTESIRDKAILLHSFGTYMQVSSIEGRSLRAPEGLHDDRADGLALANVARSAAIAIGRDPAEQLVFFDDRVTISEF